MAALDPVRTLIVTSLALGVAVGCSYIPGLSKDESKQARRQTMTPNLEVPPAFTVPDPSLNVAVPKVASAREASSANAGGAGSAVLLKSAKARLEGSPDSRWLVVDAPANAVWPRVQGFVQEEGYVISRIDPKLGVVETDWTGGEEVRPEEYGLTRFLRMAKNVFFVPDYMDKMKLRVERGDSDDQTRVFITSQRLERVEDAPMVPNAPSDSYSWGAAAPSADLDAELLNRLMIYIGGENDAEGRERVNATFQPRAELLYDADKESRIIVARQQYPIVWNRTRMALDRMGFDTVKASEEDGTLRLHHANPRLLYENVTLRGVELKQGDTLEADLTVQIKPQRKGGAHIEFSGFKASGGELPRFVDIVANRLNEQLR